MMHVAPFSLCSSRTVARCCVRRFVFLLLVGGTVGILVPPPAQAQLADTPWPAYGQDHSHRRQSDYAGPDAPVGATWFVDTGAPVRSGPVIGSDGTVYATSTSDHLYAIGPDGTETWRFQACTGLSSPPVLSRDDVLYLVKRPHWLYAVGTDGSERWRLTVSDETLVGPPVLGADGTVYLLSRYRGSRRWRGHLHAVRPNGTKKWSVDLQGRLLFPPTIGEDGTLYVAAGPRLTAVDPDGTTEWSSVMKGMSALVIAGPDGDIYTGGLKIASDGDVQKRFEHAAPVVALGTDGTRYVAFQEGLRAVQPDGEEKWWFEVDLDLDSSLPAVGADGTVYVGSADGIVYAVSPDGAVKWQFNVGESVSSLVIGNDGAVYVGSSSGFVYALNTVAPEKGPPSIAISTDTVSMSLEKPGAGERMYQGRATITIRNEGWAPLEGHVDALGAGGPFTVIEGAGSYRLKRGESRHVTLAYRSPSVGGEEAMLSLSHNSPNEKSPINIPVTASLPADVFVIVNEEPVLVGGMAALQDAVRYPDLAADSLDGRVFVQFVVDRAGKVMDPEVVRITGGLAAETVPCAVTEQFRHEALRAIQRQTFRPGRQQGRPVAVQMNLPVPFDVPAEN